MKFLFLVGSAINHYKEDEYSAYSSETRFEQTIETIKNIRKKVPNSYICLFECSQRKIDEMYRKKIVKSVDKFFEYSDDSIIQGIYENIDKNSNLITFGKSLLETYGLIKTIDNIGREKLFEDAQRIFKMSGRYLLNDSFEINDYKSKFLENKYVVKKYVYTDDEFNYYDPEVEMNNVYAYMYGMKGSMVTALWSFDRTLFYETFVILNKSFKYIQEMMQYTAGLDIEHALYKFIDKSKIINASNLGITLIKGMKGENSGVYNQ